MRGETVTSIRPKCTCIEVRPQTHLEPAEWEQNPACPQHYDLDWLLSRAPRLNFEEYQTAAARTMIVHDDMALPYLALGLANEAGEVAGKLKKVIRGDAELDQRALAGELGDVLWYLAMLSHEINIDLGVIAQRNLDKLADRQRRNMLKGDGDER